MKINRILIEKGVENNLQALKIINKFENIPTETVTEEQISKPDDLDKQTLRLLNFKGEFLKPCPGTKSYICCGYQILSGGTNCPLDCTYCILQTYFNKPSLRVFTNLLDKMPEILNIIDSQPDKLFRIGTGEFMDSLALDNITGLSDIICEPFSERKNCILELKTKTVNIERILESAVRERIIVSWSLNSPYTSASEEKGAPSIRKRLEAAGKCQDDGFIVGFHFDPMIFNAKWKEGYKNTVDLMDRYIDPQKVIWISMGCFRYIPSLKKIIRERHPGTEILNNEFIRGLDGKMRYFKPLRIEMYSFLSETLKAWAGIDPGMYLCMESDEIWRKSLGWSPDDSDGLSEYLDKRVRHFFNCMPV